MDAQQELGFCYANGKGCKKDLKEAAKWYRAAVSLGHFWCSFPSSSLPFFRLHKAPRLLVWRGSTSQSMAETKAPQKRKRRRTNSSFRPIHTQVAQSIPARAQVASKKDHAN